MTAMCPAPHVTSAGYPLLSSLFRSMRQVQPPNNNSIPEPSHSGQLTG